MRRLVRWLRRNERGQDLIEFALSALVMLLLVAGIVDFGGAFQNHIILTNAAREGARAASRLPCLAINRATYQTAVVNAVIAEAAASNITLSAANITTSPNLSTTCPTAGQPVVVTVARPYTTLFSGLLGVGTLNVRGRVEMIFFGNDVGQVPSDALSLQAHMPQAGRAPC